MPDKVNPITRNIDNARRAMANSLKSSRGKDILVYLLFVAIAFVFWVMLSLDSEAQRDIDVAVEVIDVPDSVTFLQAPPASINVSVKGKGYQLISYAWGHKATLRIKFLDYVTADGRMALSKSKLESSLRDMLGQGVSIMSVRPDSIALPFTVGPGVRVAVKVVADVRANLQSVVHGPLECDVDSVTLYSASGASGVSEIMTEPIHLRELKDTTRVTVAIARVPGMRVVPDKVTVTVPVEPLISKRRNVTVAVKNLPDGSSLIAFPSKIELSYLIPMSLYNRDIPVSAYVDYEDIRQGSGKLPVRLGAVPDICKGLSAKPDSVEYILEQD